MSSTDTILLLGGTGHVAGRLAPLLQRHGYSVIQASRSGRSASGCTGRKFDWLNHDTFSELFENVTVGAVFLVAPPILDMLPPMKIFIALAREKGVRRFVLLSASSLEAGGPAMGQVHQYLLDLKVDYAVLRPSWFMEKFSDPQYFSRIKSSGKVFSATGDGRIPWIAADDIAAVGYHALVDEPSHNSDHIILGPELLSYADVAKVLSEVIGRQISHVSLSDAELAAQFQSFGVPENYAWMLAKMDLEIKTGAEDRLNDTVLKVTGRPPITFGAFAETNVRPLV